MADVCVVYQQLEGHLLWCTSNFCKIVEALNMCDISIVYAWQKKSKIKVMFAGRTIFVEDLIMNVLVELNEQIRSGTPSNSPVRSRSRSFLEGNVSEHLYWLVLQTSGFDFFQHISRSATQQTWILAWSVR
jgi:hypothetical protein